MSCERKPAEIVTSSDSKGVQDSWTLRLRLAETLGGLDFLVHRFLPGVADIKYPNIHRRTVDGHQTLSKVCDLVGGQWRQFMLGA